MIALKLINFPLTLALSLLFSFSQVMAEPDYAREKRWADEIVPALLIGKPIFLRQKNQHQFLGIYAQAQQAQIAVIVAHGMGLNPDWGLIGNIRQSLYDFGMTTLSIQMPVLAAEAKPEDYPAIFPDAVERLTLATVYLKKQGYNFIALVSHSNGSRMSRVFMRTGPSDIDTWVALSLTRGETFAGIQVPILDFYGELDLNHVLSSVKVRKVSLISNHLSKQVMLPGADHFYNGLEEQVTEQIRDFIEFVYKNQPTNLKTKL